MDGKVASVWYASRQRIESVTKLVVFDDRGTLEESAGKLRFSGKKRTIEMSGLSAVELTRQKVNWVTYVLVNVVLVPYFWVMGTPLALAVIILVVCNVFGLVIGTQTKWVHIAFRDSAGQPGEAYFADSSTMGWGGIFGGTQKIYERLKGKAIS